MKSIFLLCSIVACGQAPKKFDLVDPGLPIEDRYSSAVARMDEISDNGWVVSRKPDGSADDQGDSLIFTGLAVHASPCDHPTPLVDAFPDGELYRHPTLTEKVSLDGALGYYIGIASHMSRCDVSKWLPGFKAHFAFSTTHGDKLNSLAEAKVEKEFTYVRDLIAHKFGLRGKPSGGRKVILEAEMSAWALAVREKKAACFRIHLAWMTLRSLELLGDGVSKNGRNAFCAASSGTDLPVVDHWCGRGNLAGWIDDYQHNEWAYRHQRCTGWETPDGNGKTQPGVDYLVAIRETYDIK